MAAAKVKAVPGQMSPSEMASLQRSVGNRAVAALVRPVVQRHSIAGAPAPPEFEGDREEASVQPRALQTLVLQRFDDGIPRVQRWGGFVSFVSWLASVFASGAGGGGGGGGKDTGIKSIDTKAAFKVADAKTATDKGGGAVKGLPDIKGGSVKSLPGIKGSGATTPWTKGTVPTKAQPATSPTIGSKIGPKGGPAIDPKLAPKIAVHPYAVAYPKTELAGDGATTIVPKLLGGPAPPPAAAKWWIVGEGYGSKVDPTSGAFTGGLALGPKEEAGVNVAFTDGVNTAQTAIMVVRSDVWQARADVKKFIKEGPFATAGGETRGRHGKWDASYDPTAKLLTVSVPMRVEFPDDPHLPTETKEQKAARDQHHKQYVTDFISQVQSRWSGKFQIKNVREPASVWSVISPVSVAIGPKLVGATDKAYFIVNANVKSKGTASVGRTAADANQRKANLFEDTTTMKTSAFMAGIRTDEMARLRTVAPHVFASVSGGVQKASQPTVEFLAQYLKALHRPEFKITVTGQDKSSATVATNRAKVVQSALGALGPHTTTAAGRVDKALAAGDEHKVAFDPAYKDPNFTVDYDVSAHEFGHMLGLPDEYANSTQSVGDKLSTYGLMERAFGNKHAEAFGRVTADSASVMHSGDDLQIHHYLYFWDILQTLSQKASAPTPKMGDADWKLFEA